MPEWLHIIWRSLLSLILLFTVTKAIGKRQLSQMSFFEYTVGITIGSIAAYIALDVDARILHGILSILVYALVPIGIAWLAMKSKIARNFVEGKATVLIKDGKIMEDNLKKERMTTDELLEQLRLKNAFRAADVEFALMEPNGQVSVMLKSQHQPLTPKHLNWQVAPEHEPQTVIMDGTIMDEGLAAGAFNRNWLQSELDKLGVALENVYLAQVDSNGQLYVDLYDDKLQVPAPQTTKLTHVMLRKCQADLELYALSTRAPRMKQVYERLAKELQQTIDDLTPLLTR
jgi:uncharacterized membrane protein YcaP (DUF421 family)